MIPPITIVLRGAPAPYRHRTAPTMHRYLPKKQRDQLAMLRHEAQEAMNGRNPLDTPVSIELQVEVPIPRSWSRKKQNSAAAGELLPGSRPDLSNMLKLAEDACTGVVFRDDALIVEQATRKRDWIRIFHSVFARRCSRLDPLLHHTLASTVVWTLT